MSMRLPAMADLGQRGRRLGVGHMLPDRAGCLIRRHRIGRLAGLCQQIADLVVHVRDRTLILWLERVGIDELMTDGKRLFHRLEHLGLVADLARQLAQVKERRGERFQRPEVSLPFQQALELAMKLLRAAK